MKNVKITCAVLCFLLITSGCNKNETVEVYDTDIASSIAEIDTTATSTTSESTSTTSNTTKITTSEVIITEYFQPVLFHKNNRDYTNVIAAYSSKNVYYKPETLYYNPDIIGYHKDRPLYANTLDVNNNLLAKGKSFNFYDMFGNKKFSDECKQINYTIRNIDGFTEIQAEFNLEFPDEILIGLSPEINPLPQTPIYTDNSIEVDLDGNSIMDKVILQTIPSKIYGEGYIDFTVNITLNGLYFTFECDPLVARYNIPIDIFVMDINSDENMEIFVYDQTDLFVYSITADTLLELTVYPVFELP